MGILSVFRPVYDSIRECYDTLVRLWRSVADEMSMCVALLPLLRSELPRPWAPLVSAVDASKYGIGISACLLDNKTVRAQGIWYERWRYRRTPPEQWKPRERSLSYLPSDCSHLSATIKRTASVIDPDVLQVNNGSPRSPTI